MSVAFRDFTPDVTKKTFFTTTFEPFEDCLVRVNEWINAENPDVINIETVVLPNLWDEEGSGDPEIYTSGNSASSWHQFVRVWYRA
jgi:hypothetical protein